MKKAKTKSKPKPKSKSKPKKYSHHPDHYNTSEDFLIKSLPEDFQEAWSKIREYGTSLGEQRIYASGKAIMFSKKVCYFFVRPKKSYLEVVIFLPVKRIDTAFKTVTAVSKTKFAHTFKLVHADQIEGELTDAITEAFKFGN